MTAGDVDSAIARARDAFLAWRQTPAPARGAVVRRLGELRRATNTLNYSGQLPLAQGVDFAAG